MPTRRSSRERDTFRAMAAAAAVGAQLFAGKAARDALFLSSFDPTTLPLVIIAAAVVGMVLVAATSTTLQRVGPVAFSAAVFGVNAALFLGLWWIGDSFPRTSAAGVYLVVSGMAPIVGSGFWLIASEHFDPRAAKKHFGPIAAAGTMGGVAGGVIAAGVSSLIGVSAILPLLAALSMVCAWQTRSWARGHPDGAPRRLESTPGPARSGFQVLGGAPYLRNLGFLVLLGTAAAVFVDYLFKVQVKTRFETPESLGHFFSLYYAAGSVLTFLMQAFASPLILKNVGLSVPLGTPSMVLLAGAATTLFAHGLAAIVATRGSESVLRGSLFRAAYEVFYTPIAPADKRAAKTIIDVGAERCGDIVGAAIIQVLIWAAADGRPELLLGAAIVCSGAALRLARLARQGYQKALIDALPQLDPAMNLAEADRHTRTALLTVLRDPAVPGPAPGGEAEDRSRLLRTDTDVQDLRTLRSRDAGEVRQLLRGDRLLSSFLVPEIIGLLSWEAAARDAEASLRRSAEEHVGTLVGALIDPKQPFVVRRRLARVLSVCNSQLAADGLLIGLEDPHAEVRYRCGHSLEEILTRNKTVAVDVVRVYGHVRRELAVSPPHVRHVFRLLGFVLPAEPLRSAYNALHTGTGNSPGVALDYLEGALPADIRIALWPFLEEAARRGSAL